MSLNYVIWNVTPQIVDFGKFEVRYYSLLFALGFVLGYIILLRIFKKQGLTVELLDRLTVYMVLSTIIGARLGHCLFYEFDYYIHHPLEIILPWRGTIGDDFEFTGFQGLASHGAAIGILIGIYLFSRKTKSAYLWTMDMIVIVTALAGCCIRTGNLMNSEIYGNPTKTAHGFVFTNDLSRVLMHRYEGTIDNVSFTKSDSLNFPATKGVPLLVNIEFSKKVKDVARVEKFGKYQLAEDMKRFNYDNNVFLINGDSVNYKVENRDRKLWLTATIGGLPRYPTQIYEAVSYLLIFFILLGIFYALGNKRKDGFIFGVFLVLLFTARFLIEFIKQNQENFEDAMAINMGQLLSIPFVMAGIALIIWKWPKSKEAA
ncbi:MAG TPA: prolipoprotein diacylglyceryl transferase [Bacteroidales bacterium]|nr:prolipoprotein diacylglyceryl transferase [Bacteroidales bacterium]